MPAGKEDDKPRGVPLRCVARVSGDSDGSHDASGVFIAGNRLELVPAGQTEGERYEFSCIFDAHAADKEVCESELTPLASQLTSGCNSHLVTLGHHRGGHMSLVDAAAPMLVDAIFDQMQQRQAAAGGQGAQLSFQLDARVACVVIGSADRMTDLLSPGSTELRIVRDAEAVGGVQLAGLRNQPVAQSTDFVKLFKSARSRLTQQHKPPAPSSVLWLDLVQRESRPGQPDEVTVSQLLIADVEVGNLGDGLAVALRAVLGSAPTRPPPPSGAALLLSDAIGGNSHAVLLGCILPTDADESSGTLGLLKQGMAFSNFPLRNDSIARGLLHRHFWHTQSLQEQLVHAEGKLHRGVEQLAQGQQQLPNQLVGATERLQGLVDAMQRDAAGQASERQQLMAEVMALRTKLNFVSGESVSLKEELMAEKKEKLALSKQLVDARLSGTESVAEKQSRLFELEQEKLAASDVLQRLQKTSEENEAKLKSTLSQLEVAEAEKRRVETQKVAFQAELHLLQEESAKWREREDELNMQLLNATNGKVAAERSAAELQVAVDSGTVEASRLTEKSEAARKELLEARAEADAAREQAASARLALERSQLQADQDTLALQRQFASSAEEQLERIRSLQADLSATRDEQSQERAAHSNALKAARDEVTRHDQMRGEINMQLDAHKEQLASLHKHVEILSGLRRPASRARIAASLTDGKTAGEGEGGEGEEGGEEMGEGDEEAAGDEGAPSPSAPSLPKSPATEPTAADGVNESRAVSRPGTQGRPGSQGSTAVDSPKAILTGGARDKLVAELNEYEQKVTATLEANRGLVEAYWRVRMLAEEAGRLGQPLSLPSHEELNLSALVLPGAHGRRSVPSELEKALSREKDAIENQLTAARGDLLVAQQSLQQTAAAGHREVGALEKELQRVRTLAHEHSDRADRLQKRVNELDKAVPAARNAELVAQLRTTQAELIQQLTALKGEGGLDPLVPVAAQMRPLTGASGASEAGGLTALMRRENDELRDQLVALQTKLEKVRSGSRPPTGGSETPAEGGGGSSSQVRVLKLQVRELEGYQAQLERERSELNRRAIYAEEQLKMLQEELNRKLAMYQREIMSLKKSLG
jgi:hypothetical protein